MVKAEQQGVASGRAWPAAGSPAEVSFTKKKKKKKTEGHKGWEKAQWVKCWSGKVRAFVQTPSSREWRASVTPALEG